MLRPALPHQNRPRIHKLSAKSLDSQPLSIRISPVRQRPPALLISHASFPLLFSFLTHSTPTEPHSSRVGALRQHGPERTLATPTSANPFNPYSFAGRDAILLPPGLYDGVHRSSTCKDKP